MLLPYLKRLTQNSSRKSKLELIFTTVLVVPFVAQIVLAVGLTGWLSLRASQESVNEVATDLRSEIIHHIHDRLKHYLEEAHKVNQLNANLATSGLVDFEKLENLESPLSGQIGVYDSLSAIAFGTEEGHYLKTERKEDKIFLGRRDESSASTALHMYEIDSFGNRVALAYKGSPQYDPRARPWYRRGKNTSRGLWTEIIAYSNRPIYAISATRAIYDKTGDFQGVIRSELILSKIDDFLEALKIGISGETFIMERSGLLVASSNAESAFRIIDGQPKRIAATDSDSPLIRATTEQLFKQFKNLTRISHPQQLDFYLEGERKFLQVMPYTDPRGLDWLIVVTIPEADFMEKIASNNRNIVWLCAIALMIAAVIGLLSARWLVKPIVRLSAAATALARGDWERTVPIEREDEIGVLAAAFNRMAEKLKASKDAIEHEKTNLAEAQAIARVGSWEWDLNANTMSWSEELFRICGLEAGKTALLDCSQWLRYIHLDDVAQARQASERAISSGEPFEIEYRIVRADGRERFAIAKGKPKKNEMGQVYKLVGTVADITERKQVEMERDKLLELEKAARQEAEAANQVKDEFLAVLSHELRTPLNPIIGWTQMLQSYKLDEENTAKALAIIERNAHLQIKLIEDLLDISRIIRGKLILQEIPVEIASVINAAIETVRLSARAKSIDLETDFQLGVGMVKGDSHRLQQVIGNLLSNAVKFTPPGGKVEVKLEREGRQARISVKDTGKGIEPTFLPYIFEHFRQENSSTTRVFGGLGLGLAIARNLVELHGGTIEAESLGVGMGATFIVTLPLIPDTLHSSEVNAHLPKNIRLDDIRILIVDDDADNLNLLKSLLEMHGASVTAVSSGKKALEAMTHFSPDVFLSDIGMPEMDGYQLIERVRQIVEERGDRTRAIALTAYARESDRQHILQAGFEKHVIKPIDTLELIGAIASMARHS